MRRVRIDARIGISGIEIEGFKSIRKKTAIEIRPLTILAGANSSGKSSMMQPLLLMKQTLEAPSDPGVFLLDGPNVRFTAASQIFSRFGTKSGSELNIRLRTIHDRSLELNYEKLPLGGVGLLAMRGADSSGQGRLLRYGESQDVFINRCFLVTKDRPSMIDFSVMLVKDVLLSMIHVPAMHGNPERTYRTTGIGPNFPGTFEHYVASLIHQWQATKDPRLSALGAALEKLGLTWKIEAAPIDDTRIELKVGRTKHKKKGGTRDLVSIADVGFGVSQCLPVLVALLYAEPNQLVYIEEPEMHLHPRAQVALAQIIADAANRGVRVVIETHSSLLLLGVQALVAEGVLPPKLVALHWFSLDEEGATEVRSAELDEAGAFGDWPEDFDEVTLNAQSRYLDAAEKKLATVKR